MTPPHRQRNAYAVKAPNFEEGKQLQLDNGVTISPSRRLLEHFYARPEFYEILPGQDGNAEPSAVSLFEYNEARYQAYLCDITEWESKARDHVQHNVSARDVIVKHTADIIGSGTKNPDGTYLPTNEEVQCCIRCMNEDTFRAWCAINEGRYSYNRQINPDVWYWKAYEEYRGLDDWRMVGKDTSDHRITDWLRDVPFMSSSSEV